jgi:muramoyltetrapeptide carboxypeptidase
MDLLLPAALRHGDTIGIAALSGPVDERKLDHGIESLTSLGYRVREASNLRRRREFLAGTDSERAAGYRELLRDTRIRAIFFARGGYGASRALAHLNPAEARTHAKIHLGASDVTAFFAWLARHVGLAAFYGPMVAVNIGAGEPGGEWERVLSGEIPAEHRFAPEDVLVPGSGEGPLVGGCLSLLASLAGTPEAIETSGAVLFWEDVAEPLYRIDRLLTQLERSSTFDRLQGMVIGTLPPAPPETVGSVRDYLRERFAGSPFPVATGFPAGHLANPRTLPLGPGVRLALEEAPALTFVEPAVRAG